MDLNKLRPRRSILKRTKARADLPRLALYMEWVGGTNQRRLLDEENNEHVIDDKVVLSYYRQVSGADGKKLLAAHWAEASKKPTADEAATAE